MQLFYETLTQRSFHQGFGKGIDVLMALRRQFEVFGPTVFGNAGGVNITLTAQSHEVLMKRCRRSNGLI